MAAPRKREKTDLNVVLKVHERIFDRLYRDHVEATAEADQLRKDLWLEGRLKIEKPRVRAERLTTLPW